MRNAKILLACAGFLLAGCGYEVRPVPPSVGSDQPPASQQPTTTVQPVTPTVADTVVVEAPPPPQTEVIVERPGPQYVWIGGYWRPWNRRWIWNPGRWDRPHAGFSVWLPPTYEHRRDGWFYVEGRWR